MCDLFRIDNQIAVVVGGTGGIGEALGHGLAEFGAKVVIAGRNQERAEQIAQDIRAELKSEAVALTVDVTDEKSVVRLAEQVLDKFGTVDILVNAQGANIKKPATEFPVNDWELMFDVNVMGIMLTCREFGKIMIENKKGKIINMSSLRGARATLWGGNEAYCATKGAVDMLTRSLASEWAPFHVNVNAIAPALINTQFADQTLQNPERFRTAMKNIPLARAGQPRELIGLCILLASSASDFITGQIIYFDGGATAVI
jgi:NAD(P)-dependent dehydrogenase (short-subunit alcohol dehydrogenase family)